MSISPLVAIGMFEAIECQEYIPSSNIKLMISIFVCILFLLLVVVLIFKKMKHKKG